MTAPTDEPASSIEPTTQPVAEQPTQESSEPVQSEALSQVAKPQKTMRKTKFEFLKTNSVIFLDEMEKENTREKSANALEGGERPLKNVLNGIKFGFMNSSSSEDEETGTAAEETTAVTDVKTDSQLKSKVKSKSRHKLKTGSSQSKSSSSTISSSQRTTTTTTSDDSTAENLSETQKPHRKPPKIKSKPKNSSNLNKSRPRLSKRNSEDSSNLKLVKSPQATDQSLNSTTLTTTTTTTTTSISANNNNAFLLQQSQLHQQQQHQQNYAPYYYYPNQMNAAYFAALYAASNGGYALPSYPQTSTNPPPPYIPAAIIHQGQPITYYPSHNSQFVYTNQNNVYYPNQAAVSYPVDVEQSKLERNEEAPINNQALPPNLPSQNQNSNVSSTTPTPTPTPVNNQPDNVVADNSQQQIVQVNPEYNAYSSYPSAPLQGNFQLTLFNEIILKLS